MIGKLRTYIGFATLLSFLISGLILNVAQLTIYVLVRPFSRDLFRTINHYLQYSYWSQTVAVTDWNTNVKCRLYYKDQAARDEFCKISGIVVANHRYDLDWLAAWMLSDKLGTLGCDKAMLKSSLRYVPVIGWGWSLCDMIFLSRNWQKDRENLAKQTKVLTTYPRSLILSYFEGTRFTKSKYEASMEFAKQKNLPIRLKHHLIPRTRGFHCMTEVVQKEMISNPKLRFGLYNFQVALDNDDNSRGGMSSILSGVPTCIHIYVERLDIMKVPTETDEANSKYLFEVYQEKDKLMDYFKQHGKFPGIEAPYKPRLQSLLNWASWMVVTYSTLVYIYFKVFATGSLLNIALLLTVSLAFIFSVRVMINSTKVSKSSSYGTSAKTK